MQQEVKPGIALRSGEFIPADQVAPGEWQNAIQLGIELRIRHNYARISALRAETARLERELGYDND